MKSKADKAKTPLPSATSTDPDKKTRLHKKKNKSKTKKSVPKVGDPDYLTPTQLRNRRKRRAKQQKSSLNSNDSEINHHTGDGNQETYPANKDETKLQDPSMKYISNPKNAPIVKTAEQYFQSIKNSTQKISDFQVHLGPLSEWRTVSKLAVRPAEKDKAEVAIGLFVPQSHILLPVPNCRAHHPSINRVVECVTRACHDVGVVPYEENGESSANVEGGSKEQSKGTDDTGAKEKGQLRYIGVNIERKTGGAQLTLVWNGDAPTKAKSGNGQEGIADAHLEKLVTKILSMSNHASSNGSVFCDDGETGQATENVEDIPQTDEPPTKKRRRRGNRESKTKSKQDDSEVNVDRKNNCNGSGTVVGVSPKDYSEDAHASQHKLSLHSLWINYNNAWKHSNAIFAYDSSCWKHVHGPPAIVEHLEFSDNSSGKVDSYAHPSPPSYPVPLYFPPNVFRQANLDAFTNIVARIRERVLTLGNVTTTHAKALPACVELYGGVGTIGLHLSDIVSSLVSSDENPNNAKCFNDSVRTLPVGIRSRLNYKQKNAADMITTESDLLTDCQVLIVDPPRKGLDEEVVDWLCSSGWRTLKLVVYVSCGFQAFQRDCNAMVSRGHWKLEFAEGYLLFPGSDAIETLAFFVPAQYAHCAPLRPSDQCLDIKH